MRNIKHRTGQIHHCVLLESRRMLALANLFLEEVLQFPGSTSTSNAQVVSADFDGDGIVDVALGSNLGVRVRHGYGT